MNDISKQNANQGLSKKSIDLSENTGSVTSGCEKSIGVRKAEILAAQWDTWYYKIILLFSAFLVGYAYGLDGQLRSIFTGYATNSFDEHSLLTTVLVITSFVGAGAQPVYARLSDVFGRLEIFIVSIGFYVIGTIIESQAHDVQRYAGGSILYQIGYTGVILVLVFILSDFSSLKWRLLYTLCPTFPFIINTWVSGDVSSALGDRWSWAIGLWAFVFPLACVPLICCMIHMRYLAGKTEDWKQFKQRKTKFQELGFAGFMSYLFWELDIIGLILLEVSLGCTLVPLTLAGGMKSKWQKGNIIAPLVIGVVIFPIFILWEIKYARNPVAPWHLIKDRGIWSALGISFLLNLISSIGDSYLYAVLLVAVNESQKSATRITSLASFVSTIAGLFYGLFVVKIKKLKLLIIFGCSLWMVAYGILTHYRGSLESHAGIIGGLCLLGFGTTFFSYPVFISVQSCVTHENMARATSLVWTVYRIGAAVGTSIVGAIWSQTLFNRLYEKIGDENLAVDAYSAPYDFVAEYPWNTPVRQDVVQVYKDIQKILMIICVVFCVPMIFLGIFLRDHRLGNDQSIENIEDKEKNDSLGNFLKKYVNVSSKSKV